jgi:hypothetical protein
VNTPSNHSSGRLDRTRGPQQDTQPDLEFRERHNVRPGQAIEYGSDSRPVNAGNSGNLSNASVTDGFPQVEDQLPRYLGDRVIARHRRPVDTQLVWGDTSWARTHMQSLSAAIGAFSDSPLSEVAGLLSGCSYSQMNEGVRAVMTNYKPQRSHPEWARIEAFVKDACSLAAPKTTYTASLLLTVTSAFALWCVADQGWPLQADVIFSRQAIDMYCSQENPDRSEGTRRNYRAILMRVSEVVAPEEHPDAMTPLSRKRIAEPYSNEEMNEFSLWAVGQNSTEKRRRAMLMLAFCAGAGLKSSDVSTIYPDDVVVDKLGITITVGGTNPRLVPLEGQWETWMVAILAQVPRDIPIWGKPNRTLDGKLLSSFTQYTVGQRPRGDRLRATWIVDHLRAGTRIKELMRALGVDKFENLPRYLEFVDALDDDCYRTELRGEVRP